jgi:hypothetical protein
MAETSVFNDWTFKKSGALSYSSTLGPAFISDERDQRKINKELDEYEKLFNERKIGTLKYLGKLFGFILKLNDPNVISTRVEALKDEGKKVRVLDLMGYGSVIRKLDTSGLAVAFEDFRTSEEKDFDKERGVGFVTGNVLSSKTWGKIDEDVKLNGPFDLVLCRPLGGKINIPEREMIYSALINKMYSVTNPDGGMILTEFHRGMKEKVNDFVRNISKVDNLKGIRAKSAMGAFCLTRKIDSPDTLPVEAFSLN